MADRVEHDHAALGDPAVDVLTDRGWGDRVDAALSDRNVTRANWAAMSGSVRQKLLVSSSPSSGRSGRPMITGAIWADQPR